MYRLDLHCGDIIMSIVCSNSKKEVVRMETAVKLETTLRMETSSHNKGFVRGKAMIALIKVSDIIKNS